MIIILMPTMLSDILNRTCIDLFQVLVLPAVEAKSMDDLLMAANRHMLSSEGRYRKFDQVLIKLDFRTLH